MGVLMLSAVSLPSLRTASHAFSRPTARLSNIADGGVGRGDECGRARLLIKLPPQGVDGRGVWAPVMEDVEAAAEVVVRGGRRSGGEDRRPAIVFLVVATTPARVGGAVVCMVARAEGACAVL